MRDTDAVNQFVDAQWRALRDAASEADHAAEQVIARRRAERERLLIETRAYVEQVGETVALRAAVVYGSVARGDFNLWSDVDLLVVAEELPDRLLDRLDALPARPPRVRVVAWTPQEWRAAVARANPIAVEAMRDGQWLNGGPGLLRQPPQ